MYPSIFKSFPVIRTASAKKFPFSRTAAHIFVSPGNAPAIMTQSVAWMERQFNACQTPRSMYLSIFNTFRVIRRLIQSISQTSLFFYHILVSPGDAPGAITLSVVWDGKRIRCLQIVSQYVPIYLQQFPSYSNCKCKKITVFTYRSPHFCFPWRRPCDYHAIGCMDGKTIQCLPNPSQHVPIYLQ